ncbi:hypothetical protein JMJ77_0014370 [Colletotrichum scovillei]|uniref:Uncharacterized protein n=1 Tax=Colletotrichum scovillei TaxID=1209932 RepID=A0A9P7R3B6_9PEZI|nr:hypothetical protein JMJ77_0014370 [Colletotrichum scovillei]KAG7065901.1 hypothetical protein JMJ78_0012644 [Colletotrichum scovillei]KAG7068502.1 hypothetical protein JMJ76_0008188 [Colletotrichum scovillei]
MPERNGPSSRGLTLTSLTKNRNPLSSEDEIILLAPCHICRLRTRCRPHKFHASIHARIQAKFHADSYWGKLQSSDADTDTAPGMPQRQGPQLKLPR